MRELALVLSVSPASVELRPPWPLGLGSRGAVRARACEQAVLISRAFMCESAVLLLVQPR